METLIKKDGWIKSEIVGSHHHYKHPIKKGKVTIPFHSNRELSKFVVNNRPVLKLQFQNRIP
ncbi:MAG: type II toxin-antitoxin system HicA family toxin [Treponema sp.]